MGCDIHTFVEVKVNGKWNLFDQPSVSRDYELFALMGLKYRGDTDTPISELKGLPNDISEMTAIMRDYWGVDGHSDSWFSITEIEKIKDWYRSKTDGYSFYRDFGYKILDLEDYEFLEDTRLVFWFDN